MKKLFSKLGILICLVIMVSGLTGCFEKVPAGYTGVKVYLLGANKGVSNTEALGVGRYWIGWNEELHLFPTFVQTYIWTSDKNEQSPINEEITFQDKNGLEIKTDLGLAYRIKEESASLLFQRYQRKLKDFTNVILRGAIRDSFSKNASTMDISEIYGPGKAQLLTKVIKDINDKYGQFLAEINIYLVGSMRLPGVVQTALDAKIKATQVAIQRENEVAEAKAQANKDVAIAEGQARAILTRAEAEAKANKIVAASLTPELIKAKQIEKWNGENSKVITGNGGGVLVNMQ